jgi:putative MATE family efflux protein
MQDDNADNSDDPDKRRINVYRDWTQGSILRNLLTLAWPVFISNTLNMAGPTIDMIWVGRLGAAAMAAVGLSAQIVMVVNALLMGFFTSLRAMVARRIGEHDDAGANVAFQQAFILGVGVSIILSFFGIFFAKDIIALFHTEEDVATLALPYTQVQFISTITMTILMLVEATMQSSGDTMTAMRIGIAFRIVHIVLCPFLVFGLWIFPELGVVGAAVTSVIAQVFGGAIGFWILLSGRSRLHVTFRGFKIDPVIIWRQVKIGIPASANNMLRNFLSILIFRVVVPFGTVATASYSLIQRIDNFLDVGSNAIGNAAGALTGQNLGAKKPDRAAKTAWLGVSLATVFMIIISVIVLFWTEGIVKIFNNESEIVSTTATLLRIAVLGFLFMGAAGVLTTCLNQVGDTMIPLVASLVTMWAIQLPLAIFMPKFLHNEVFGVYWAIVIALALRGIIYVIYFKAGRWKHRRV